MTHVQGMQDADLHDENGEHITTPPTADGHQVELWERRIKRHLALHLIERAENM